MIEEVIIRRVLEWLITETIGKKALEEIKKKAGLDDFTRIGKRTLYENIEGNKDYIRILNLIRESQVFEVKDPSEINEEEICCIFLEENDKKICHEFLESLREKYYNIVIELADNNPVTKIIFKKFAEHEERLQKVEEYVDRNRVFDIKCIAQIQKEIEEETKKIGDFVGRKSIIENFDPEKPLFVEGKVGIGKTYLLKKLAPLYSGTYIPLKRIRDIKTLKTLVERATVEGKRLFIDDFDYATEEIKEYVSTYVWNAVISSRPPISLKRDINRIVISSLEKEDIEEYFEIKRITVEKVLLEKLKEDLSLPLKLRVFVNFLKSRDISYLDLNTYHDILEEVGSEELHLPEELENWYDMFIWRDFDKEKYANGAKQALFILALMRISVNVDIISQILEVDEETTSNIVESLRAFIDYHAGYFHIFHESISNFIKNKIGDSVNLNIKIGDTISSLPYLIHRWEALYHYRKAKSKDRFEKVFSLEDIEAQIFYGYWTDALENMNFSEKNGISTDIGEFSMVYGILLMELGRWDDALERFEKSLKAFRSIGNEYEMAKTYMNMGLLLTNKGEWKKAEECYNRSLKIIEEIEDRYGIAKIYENIGVLLVNKGEWKKAEEYYTKSLRIEEEIGDKHGIAHIYNNIGALSLKKGEWKKAEECYNKSLKIEEEIGDEHGIAQTYIGMGFLLTEKGEWKKAEECYNKSLKIREKMGDKYGISHIYGNKGVLLANRGEWKKAEEYYSMSLKIKEEIGDKHGIAQTYMNMGLLLTKKGEWDKAEEYYSNSLKIEREIGDKNEIAKTYGNIGTLFTRRCEWKKAGEYYSQDLKISIEIGDRLGEAQTYMNMGILFAEKGEWKKAEECYNRSLEIKEEIGDRYGIAKVYGSIGILSKDKGELDKAEECYNKTLEMFKEIGDKYEIAHTYMNMGLLSKDTGEWDMAEEYYNKSLKIEEEIGDEHGIAQTYSNIGTLFADKGEWKKAKEYYDKSLKIIEEIGDRYNIAKMYTNMGSLFMKIRKWVRAEEYFEKSLEIERKIEDKHGIARTYSNIGALFTEKGDLDKAEECYNKTLRMFKEIGDRHGMALIYDNMGIILSKRGEWRKAEECYNKSLKIKEEIGDKYGIAQIYINISELKRHEGDYENSLRLLNEAMDIFVELGAKNEIWKTSRNEFHCLFEMKEFGLCINSISEMFRNSYREELIDKTITILEKFIIAMEKILRWDMVSQIGEISLSIKDTQKKCLLEVISAYGKIKLRKISSQEFKNIRSQLQDEYLSEILDRIIANDPT